MENKEKQFVICSDYDMQFFERMVNEYIEKGYHPVGNIVIAPNGRFVLAMVKNWIPLCSC